MRFGATYCCNIYECIESVSVVVNRIYLPICYQERIPTTLLQLLSDGSILQMYWFNTNNTILSYSWP